MPASALPEPNTYVADAVCEWLQAAYGMTRPPWVAANLLVFVVQLYEDGRGFPRRQAVAKHLGCTQWGVDAALRVSLVRKLIRIRVGITTVEYRHRKVIRQHRRYEPDAGLLELVQQARADLT
jgi:hypothetical protein